MRVTVPRAGSGARAVPGVPDGGAWGCKGEGEEVAVRALSVRLSASGQYQEIIKCYFLPFLVSPFSRATLFMVVLFRRFLCDSPLQVNIGE